MYTYVCMYIYMYIYRERERELLYQNNSIQHGLAPAGLEEDRTAI